jgi:hypothetical protein
LSTRLEPVLILANAASNPGDGREPLILNYLPNAAGQRIHIGLPSFVVDLLHIPPRTLDLLEIAAYVFAADRCLLRGQKDAVEYQS